jgi:outer membrane protein
MRGIYAIMAFLLLLAAATPARGGEKLILGLPQLIRMAIEKSPEIAETKSGIAGARSQLAQAEAAYYPQLDTTALLGPVNNTRRPAVAGTRIIDPSADLSVGVFGRMDLTLTQPLYTFGKISNRREAAARGVAASEAQLPRKKSIIALRIKELYYGLVLARAGVEAARDAAGYFDEARRRMKRLLELDSPNVLESDLLRIDAYTADTVRGRAVAEKGVNTAYFALKSFIGLPEGVDFEPADRMLGVGAENLGDLADHIRDSLSGRPELKQLEHALQAQKSSVEGAVSDTYPSFFAAVAGSFAGAPGRQAFHNPYFPDQFNHVTGGIVGGMKWHFDFGIARARIEKERADYEKLLHAKATAELGIPIEVAQRYYEAREWRTAVGAYELAVSSARKWIVAALTNFDMGVGTADDLLRSIERYGQSRGKYLEALFEYNMSLARLDYAMGVQRW